jgi:NAD(P)-dependent dehydrogenase (short-subunit alcohol dehydrogenase family)
MPDPVALVTGASRGIGEQVARQLAEAGHRILVTGRDVAAAAAVADSLPGQGHRSLRLDVTDAADVDRVAAEVTDTEGRLDVLINNAAAYVDWNEAASSADLDAARAVMETNLFGPWHLMQAFLPLLRHSPHPRLVNVASGAGSHGDEQFGLARRGGQSANYGISKAALLALTSTLAAELDGSKVLVNAVCPGLTATWPGAESMGARPVADGAAGVVWAALLPDDGPHGGFFRNGHPLPW